MSHRQAALGHHLHQVSQAQLKSKIPAHAQDDDVAVEVTTLEQLLDRLQLGHCRPSARSARQRSRSTVPFAPEPVDLAFLIKNLCLIEFVIIGPGSLRRNITLP